MNPPIASSAGAIRPMLRLATPVLIEQLLFMMVAFVDQWLAGKYLEEDHLAAIGLVWYVLWLVPSLFSVVSIGATALVARFVGAGNHEDAVEATNQAIGAAGILCVLAMAFALLTAGPFVWAMQLEPNPAALSLRYIWFLLPVFPAIMLEQVGIACLRGAGDTVSGFLAMTLVNVVNTTLGVVLVIGMGPFPRLGWDGLAIGTAGGHVVGAAIVLVLLIRGRAGLQLHWRRVWPHTNWLRRLLRIGIPGGVDTLFLVACHLWFLSIINSLGTLPAAAHGLGVRIESISYLPGTAFQVAAATLAGQYLGAGDRRRAVHSSLLACLVGGGVMAAAGCLLYFQARPLAMFFLGGQTSQVADLAAPLLQLVAFSIPSLAIVMILTGALRGAGDTRVPMLITFVGLLLVRIPLAYAFAMEEVTAPFIGVSIPGLGLGVWGAWCAMVTDLVVRSVLVAGRFWHGGWTRISV